MPAAKYSSKIHTRYTWVERKKSAYSTDLTNKAIGIAVLVPESGNGGAVAAPIAREVLQQIMPKMMKLDIDKASKN